MARSLSLSAAVLLGSCGWAVGQGQCIDTQLADTACEGDAYSTLKGDALDECCAQCAQDEKCVQWSYKPAGFVLSSHCTLSSVKSAPNATKGHTCAVKKPPAPPAPTPAPAPPMPGANQHWAVIMAGSNTYDNYRHQADACHAYQIAKKNGIPESNIILLAFDDIAESARNPFKGKVFNKPNGPDVYAGCNISYKGKDVNKANFLNVLTGNSAATGPVLKSTANDRVFVYFADHGGVGILGVPDGSSGGWIHAKEINQALDTMHSKGMYKELLFYVEACESGSIFKNLLTTPNVVVVTAANAHESSWGQYCPPQDVVNNKNIGSCLGDTFSINWMGDADFANFKAETVAQQIAKVTNETTKSHVQVFGNSSAITGEAIGAFEGAWVTAAHTASNISPVSDTRRDDSQVNTRDIPVHLAYSKMQRAETLAQSRAAQADLAALLAGRTAVDAMFVAIATEAMHGDEAKAQTMVNMDIDSLLDVDCHMQSLQTVSDSCGPFNDYSMRYSRLFANLCNVEGLTTDQIDKAVKSVCGERTAGIVI